MSGSTPLGGADAALTSVVERLIEKELASLAADGKNLRELVTPGEVLVATVRPSNGLTDILEILGNRVAAALPPELLPGDTINVRVTGFDGERIVLQNLGPVVEDPPGSAPASAPPLPAGPPPAPQPGAVSYVSDAEAAPTSFGADAQPAATPPTVAPSSLPTFADRAPSVAPDAPTDLASSNIVPLPRDRSGGGGAGGGSRQQRDERGAPSDGPAAEPTQEELAARFPGVDIRLSRTVIGPLAARGPLAPSAPTTPPVAPAPNKLAFLSAEFSDLPDRASRPDDGLPRVAVNPILFAKLPPTLPPGAELLEATQQELFADVALAAEQLAVEDPADELRAAPLPPPVRGDVTVPRPLSGDGIPVPSTPDRDGLAAPPSVPRSFVPATPGRVTPQAPSAIPAYVEARTPTPRVPSPDAKPIPPVPEIAPPDAIEARIAAARTAPGAPAPSADEETRAPVRAVLPEAAPVRPAENAVPLADASARASEALRAVGLRKPATPGDAQAEIPVRRPFVPPLVFRPASAPVRDAAVPPPPLPGARLPSAPPVIPLRAVPDAASVPPAAPSAQADPAEAVAAPASATAVPREATALLRALQLPITAMAVASAKLALERPEAVPAALDALERALPAGDPRTATLRTIAAFTARLDPAAPTFAAQLAAYVDHVLGGPEPVLRDLAAADAIATDLADGVAETAAPASATPSGQLETLALARIAERVNAADGQLKTQIAQVLALARLDPALEAAAPQLHAALAALTAQQVGGSPPGTHANANVVEFAIPLPLTGEGNVARIRIERDAANPHAKLDGDDFRIAFVLDTKHLGTVAIDLATVGRSVDVGVKTEAQRSADVFKGALASLRQRLEHLRYRVASAHAGVARPGAVPERAWPPPAPVAERDARALVDRNV